MTEQCCPGKHKAARPIRTRHFDKQWADADTPSCHKVAAAALFCHDSRKFQITFVFVHLSVCPSPNLVSFLSFLFWISINQLNYRTNISSRAMKGLTFCEAATHLLNISLDQSGGYVWRVQTVLTFQWCLKRLSTMHKNVICFLEVLYLSWHLLITSQLAAVRQHNILAANTGLKMLYSYIKSSLKLKSSTWKRSIKNLQHHIYLKLLLHFLTIRGWWISQNFSSYLANVTLRVVTYPMADHSSKFGVLTMT